jgi:IclR family transcriptional regulator, KDG regulon repressor
LTEQYAAAFPSLGLTATTVLADTFTWQRRVQHFELQTRRVEVLRTSEMCCRYIIIMLAGGPVMALATNSLERALVILQLIGQTAGGLTNLEISRELKIARSTCSYILSRLEREGYLVRDKSTGKYRIGLKTLILGRGALREVGFRVVSEPTLYRLATETGLAANLAVLEGDRVLVLDRIEGFAFVKAAIEESHNAMGGSQGTLQPVKGHREATRGYREASLELPVRTTALGRVLLAYLPTDRLQEFVRRDSAAEKRSKTEGAEDLLSALSKTRQQGYYMMHFEPHNESCSLAAPIFDASDTVKAAVSVSCKRHLPIWNDEHGLSEMVKEAAWEISAKLHYPKAGDSSQTGRSSGANANQSASIRERPRTRAS